METPELKHYNIRVYGIIMNDENEVLLSDEYFHNVKMTKFPGGGMNLGEGPVDCLMREAMEEFGQEIEITGHFYTTHFFQRSLFFPDEQLICIYYKVRFKEPLKLKLTGKPFDFAALVDGAFSFRWASLNTLQEDDLTLPVDRYVVKLLKGCNSYPF